MRILGVDTENRHEPALFAFRRPTPGPEFDLLMQFVETSLPTPERSESLAVFIEPRLETGCPDAVAVYWRTGAAEDTAALAQLTPQDDKLMHFVWLEGHTGPTGVEERLGRAAGKRVRELIDLGLIRESDSSLTVHDPTLALSRLIAIEAKVSAPSHALTQAVRNTWYASESYVLMPSMPLTQSLCDRYSSCGVGIVLPCDELARPSVPAEMRGLPQSHVTWRFNRVAIGLCDSGAA